MGAKGTNFSLSNEERKLLSDVTFFKLKIALTGHISEIFGNLESVIQDEAHKYHEIIPAPALAKRGKISKGENYLGLPYMVLDHPATFGKDGILAFRTMMWWGHPFTTTFHVSGKFLEKLKPGFSGKTGLLNEKNVFVCVNPSQWVHHNEESNYISFEKFNKDYPDWKSYAMEKGFLKASIRIPIDQSENLEPEVINFIQGILEQLN